MTKTRIEGSAVVWSDPTGRSWTSPSQHLAPADAGRPQPHTIGEPHDLSPDALAELLASPDTDPIQYELRTVEAEPADTDRLRDALLDDDGWGLALDDPSCWTA